MSNSSSSLLFKLSRRARVILLVVLVVPVHALDRSRSLSEFSNQVWLTENGLPQNTVQAIIQTRDGYLWIGTQEGLAKFNGTGFVLFDKENTPQLKSNDVRALLEDRAGALWIATSYGLLRMQSGTFTAFTTTEGLPDNSVSSVLSHREFIYAGTRGGLAQIAGGRVVRVFKDSNSKLSHNWVTALCAVGS